MNPSNLRSTSMCLAASAPRIAPAAILATLALGLGVFAALPSPAAAYDDHVDVVCFDFDDGKGGTDTDCMTIDELTAECELSDPEFTSEECGGLLENRVPASNSLTTTKQKRDPVFDTGINDPGGRGRDGGSSGGGSSGGGSNGDGSSSGGGGPNG